MSGRGYLTVGLLLLVGTLVAGAGRAGAFSDAGHHVVAVLAYERLTPAEQAELQRLLAANPRFERDFAVPESIAGDAAAADRWRVGVAGTWPDVIRRTAEYDRPSWHYQLGATLVVGDPAASRVPATPGPLPPDADLATPDLHIAQAIALAEKVLADAGRPDADRAIAACWLIHLVGDSHQPCHAGSLYTPRAFPDGDQGANRIPLALGQNLHAFWDGLLGRRAEPGDVRRRVGEIRSDAALMAAAEQAIDQPADRDPLLWLAESRALSLEHVYTPEVLAAVSAVERGLAEAVPPVTLPEASLTRAGRIGQLRAAQAGARLADALRRALARE